MTGKYVIALLTTDSGANSIGFATEMQDRRSWTPVHFLYLNFHDAIRSELEDVQNDVRSLERAPEKHVNAMLLGLRDRCRFLEQVHSYHSSVEDEVVYPALDAKVKNVTVAYSHEHRDEVGLCMHGMYHDHHDEACHIAMHQCSCRLCWWLACRGVELQ